MSSIGIEIIAAERARQINVEGWTAAHDDLHAVGEMAAAAACYAMPLNSELRADEIAFGTAPVDWPWDRKGWKPARLEVVGETMHPLVKERIHELAKAGALIAAEIELILRSKP